MCLMTEYFTRSLAFEHYQLLTGNEKKNQKIWEIFFPVFINTYHRNMERTVEVWYTRKISKNVVVTFYLLTFSKIFLTHLGVPSPTVVFTVVLTFLSAFIAACDHQFCFAYPVLSHNPNLHTLFRFTYHMLCVGRFS